jgi:hypothetical protein
MVRMNGWTGALALLLAAGTAACAGDSVELSGAGMQLSEAQAGDTVRLGVGQSVRVGSMTVAFRGIGEDSRCPIDALCVWPGSAEALLDVSTAGGAATRVSLHTLREPAATDQGPYRVRLLYVEPAQQSDRTIPANEYRVALEIARR